MKFINIKKLTLRNQSLLFRVARVAMCLSLAVFGAFFGGGIAHAKAKKKRSEPAIEEALRFKAGDESGNELKALKAEILVSKSEALALAQLKKLEKKYAGTRMEPEILFRLAEIYMRRARTERFFEIHRNSEQVAIFAPQLVKDASESGEIRKAVSIYRRIQAKHQNFRSMDAVIFNHAYASQQLGENLEAERLFSQLIQEHPSSPLVPDSYLAIGEINFGRRNYAIALENFRAIRKFPQARAFPYGLYKAAWCFYNMQDAESGLRQLEEVVRFGHAMAKEGRSDVKLDLRKESLNDMALFYGDVRAAKDAVAYFRKHALDLDATPYVMRLAQLYTRHSRFADIENVLTEVLEKLPHNESTTSVYEELVWNYDRMKNRDGAVRKLVAFDQWCEALNKKGGRIGAEVSDASRPSAVSGAPDASSSTASSAAHCGLRIAEASKKLASKWHASWNSARKNAGESASTISRTEIVNQAEQLYRLSLKNLTLIDPDLPAIRFSYAELLFARGSFRSASESYAMIDSYRVELEQELQSRRSRKAGSANLQRLAIDQSLAHDAAYAALVSLENATAGKWSDEDEKLFAQLANVYHQRFPEGAHGLDIRFKRGFIAYEKGRYDEAAAQFKPIGWTEESPSAPKDRSVQTALSAQGHDKRAKAQDLYLDILNIKKDFSGLKKAAQALLVKKGTVSGSSGALSQERLAQIEKIYREAFFSEIQTFEEKGEISAAITAYKQFAVENATSDLAPKAWWNASQLELKMGDAQASANTCHQMYKLFPKTPSTRECLGQAARTFEAMARLDLAARVLLNLAMVDPEQQDKWRELAADFFALSDSKDRAITMYTKLAENRKSVDQVRLLEKARSIASGVTGRAVDGGAAATDWLYEADSESGGHSAVDSAVDLAMDSVNPRVSNRVSDRVTDSVSGPTKELKSAGILSRLSQIENRFSSLGIEPQASRLLLEKAEAFLVKGDLTEAFNLAKKIVARETLPKNLQARARLVQARVLEDEYRKQSVKSKVDRIGLVLAIKTEKLEKAQKAFQSTVRYGDPETSVTALRALAECYLDYSKALRGINLGAGVSNSELAAFRAEIEQIAIPMEEKGIEAMSQALQAARKAQLRDGQIAELRAAVDRLNMKSSSQPEVKVARPVIYLPSFRAPASREVGL